MLACLMLLLLASQVGCELRLADPLELYSTADNAPLQLGLAGRQRYEYRIVTSQLPHGHRRSSRGAANLLVSCCCICSRSAAFALLETDKGAHGCRGSPEGQRRGGCAAGVKLDAKGAMRQELSEQLAPVKVCPIIRCVLQALGSSRCLLEAAAALPDHEGALFWSFGWW